MQLEALYGIIAGDHSFVAHLQGTEPIQTLHAVLNGQIAETSTANAKLPSCELNVEGSFICKRVRAQTLSHSYRALLLALCCWETEEIPVAGVFGELDCLTIDCDLSERFPFRRDADADCSGLAIGLTI